MGGERDPCLLFAAWSGDVASRGRKRVETGEVLLSRVNYLGATRGGGGCCSAWGGVVRIHPSYMSFALKLSGSRFSFCSASLIFLAQVRLHVGLYRFQVVHTLLPSGRNAVECFDLLLQLPSHPRSILAHTIHARTFCGAVTASCHPHLTRGRRICRGMASLPIYHMVATEICTGTIC